MKITKALAGVILLAGMAASAVQASDAVTAIGHASVSVNDPFGIAEKAPVKFGNIVVTHPGAGDANVTLGVDGARAVTGTNTDVVSLLNGSGSTPATTGSDDAGSQGPGIYFVDGAMASTNIYITFAEPSGTNMLIDSNHPSHHATIGTAPNNFTADTFVFSGSNGGGTDVYGQYVACNASGEATVSVGASLHTVAGATYADGTYRGTFYIMASY